MKVMSIQRTTTSGSFYDVILATESEAESKTLDLLGPLGQILVGQVRLADEYGDHYVLLRAEKDDQPEHNIRP